MTSTSKNLFAALSTVAVFSLGMSGAALAQQGMPTATESELNATWIDGSARSTVSTDTPEQSARGRAGDFGYPVNDGLARSGQPSAQRGASIVFQSENGSWVDGSARSTANGR